MKAENFLLMMMVMCVFGQLVNSVYGQSVDISAADSHRKPRFISFDTNSGKIDINLDLSVPFLSIPLEDKHENGGPPMPLLNINTKALAVFGTLMAISAFVVPLFVKKLPEPSEPADLHHHHHYRTNRGMDLSYFGDSLNEILFQDSRVTPCVQRIVCSAVSTASRSDSPTSVDKIIDGLSSLRWFEQAANGTVIKEAVAKGRETPDPEECIATYKGCILNQQLIANVLKIIGV